MSLLVYFLIIHVHFSLFCVCMPFPLVVSPLHSSLWGHVAGSRSVSQWPQVSCVGRARCCYCEGRKTSSMDALLVNVWNLILWARAPWEVNMASSQSIHPTLVSFLTLCTPSATVFMLWDILCEEIKWNLYKQLGSVKGNRLCANEIIMFSWGDNYRSVAYTYLPLSKQMLISKEIPDFKHRIANASQLIKTNYAL